MRHSDSCEDGFTLVEVLVGIAIFAALAGSLLFAGAAYGRSLRQSATLQAATTAATTSVESLERDGRSSIAIFTPAQDVANRANSDGHEVDFYTRAASGTGSFAAYCFKRSASTCSAAQADSSLGLYRYAWSALPQNGGSGATWVGSVADSVVRFSAKTIAASALLDQAQNPTTAAYFARIGVTSANDVARLTGFPGVLAGNRVTIVALSTSAGTRSVHLVAGATPTHRQIVVATYTPPPNPMSVTTAGGGSTVAFPYPLAAAQTATFAENNYGTRTTSPAQVYTVIGTTCSGSASYSPETIAPASDGSGRGSMTVQPVVKAQPAAVGCSVTVSDNSGQTQTITVQIGQTYTPSASAPAAGRPGQNGIFTIQEQNYPTAPFAIALSGACSNPTVVSSAQSAGAYAESVQVSYTTAGTCSITATDGYGQTATSSTLVYDVPVYVLSVTSGPTPSTIFPGQTSTFTASATQTKTSVPPGTPASVPVLIAGASGPCSSTHPDTSTFTLAAIGTGTCSLTIAADASSVSGATTQDSPMDVSVGAIAAPSPAPAATPTPAPVISMTPAPVPTSAPVPSPAPTLFGFPGTPTPTPTPALLAPVTVAWFATHYYEPPTSTRCNPAKNVITLGNAYLEGALVAPAAGMAIGGSSIDALVSDSNTINQCTGSQTPSFTRLLISPTFAIVYSPQSTSPSPLELQRRVQSDIQFWCAQQGCPGSFLWPTGMGGTAGWDLAPTFDSMAASWSSTPSPNNIIYGQRWGVTATSTYAGTLIGPCSSSTPSCP
jgi:prepilin-type N-terminal cleavage/methylation domain-containing protein